MHDTSEDDQRFEAPLHECLAPAHDLLLPKGSRSHAQLRCDNELKQSAQPPHHHIRSPAQKWPSSGESAQRAAGSNGTKSFLRYLKPHSTFEPYKATSHNSKVKRFGQTISSHIYKHCTYGLRCRANHPFTDQAVGLQHLGLFRRQVWLHHTIPGTVAPEEFLAAKPPWQPWGVISWFIYGLYMVNL